jgi:hypothetical protein
VARNTVRQSRPRSSSTDGRDPQAGFAGEAAERRREDRADVAAAFPAGSCEQFSPGRVPQMQRDERHDVPGEQPPHAGAQGKIPADHDDETDEQAEERQEPDSKPERLTGARGHEPRSERALVREETDRDEERERDERRAYRPRVSGVGRLVLRHWRPPRLR